MPNVSSRVIFGTGWTPAPQRKEWNLGNCVNHPDRETSYACLKHNIYMCAECLDCRDPQIYCKFRSACPIHFLTRRKGNLDGETETKEAAG